MIAHYTSPTDLKSTPTMLGAGLSSHEDDFLSAILHHLFFSREYSDDLGILLREVFTERREKHWYFEGTSEDFQLSSEYQDPYSDFYKRFFTTHIKPGFASQETAFSLWEKMSACGRFLLCTYALCVDRPSVDSFAPHPGLARITTYELLQICNELNYLRKVVTNDRKLSKEIKNRAVSFLAWQHDVFLKEMKNRNRSCSEIAAIKIRSIVSSACSSLAACFSYLCFSRQFAYKSSLSLVQPTSQSLQKGKVVVYIDCFDGVVVDREINPKKSR